LKERTGRENQKKKKLLNKIVLGGSLGGVAKRWVKRPFGHL